MRREPTPLAITLAYVFVSALWIALSDRIVLAISNDPSSLAQIQTVKGLGFVAVTALGIYWLTRRAVAVSRRIAQERRHMEQQLQDYASSLEQRVAERTAQVDRVMNRVQTILNSTSDAILLIYADGTVEQANMTFNELFGYDFDDLFRKPLSTLAASEREGQQIQNLTQRVIDLHQTQRFEFTAVCQNGRTFDADLLLAPVDMGRDQYAAVASLRDISHIRDVERLKTQFVANAAHDLANPIASLKVRLALLRRTPDQLEKHLRILDQQTQRLERLVEGLRTLTRLDRGMIALEREAIDFNQVVSCVIDAQTPLAQARQQTLRFTPGADLPEVRLDPFQFERVIVNLVVNALNYTPQGGLIHVSTYHADGMCHCRVEDSGIGIHPEALPHIFERFYRAEQDEVYGVEGTGLGLAIAKEITELHDGAINVTSTPGAGSCFTVSLPC